LRGRNRIARPARCSFKKQTKLPLKNMKYVFYLFKNLRSGLGKGAEVHAYNPSYLGGREEGEWEQGLRPAWAKSQQDPISTNKLHVVVQACGPLCSFATQEVEVGRL
jgi:hypothetical protein